MGRQFLSLAGRFAYTHTDLRWATSFLSFNRFFFGHNSRFRTRYCRNVTHGPCLSYLSFARFADLNGLHPLARLKSNPSILTPSSIYTDLCVSSIFLGIPAQLDIIHTNRPIKVGLRGPASDSLRVSPPRWSTLHANEAPVLFPYPSPLIFPRRPRIPCRDRSCCWEAGEHCVFREHNERTASVRLFDRYSHINAARRNNQQKRKRKRQKRIEGCACAGTTSFPARFSPP